MAADAVVDERRQLEEFQQLLEKWHEDLVQDLPQDDAGLPEDYFRRVAHTATAWSTLISRQIPPALDPEEVAEMRGDLIEILGAVADSTAERPLDSLDAVMVHLEAIRHVVRDAIDGHVVDEGDARELLRALERNLPRITRNDLGALLGTSDRSIQRMLKSATPVEPPRRLLMVARLVELLRRAWTPEGVVAWFFRPRPELDGQTPIELLDDPAAERLILSAAKQGRAQHGS